MINLTEQELLALIQILLKIFFNKIFLWFLHILYLLLSFSEAIIEYLRNLRGVSPHNRQESQVLLSRRKCLF